MVPIAIIPLNPKTARCACATTQWVKCVTRWIDGRDCSGPWTQVIA
jgi:hypothetical protein